MKFIRVLIITLLFCTILISPVCAFQIYEEESYTPTENISIGTEIVSTMTLLYEPKEASLISSLVINTELYNPKWEVYIGNDGGGYTHMSFNQQKVKIPAFDFDYKTRIVEIKLTITGTVQKEVTNFILLEEYRDNTKLRDSYPSNTHPHQAFSISSQYVPSNPVETPIQETPEALYQILYPYQEQINDLGNFIDVTKYQKEYDGIKANIDNYASPKPQYTDKEIKSQIEGLKMDLLSVQRNAMESNLNAIRGIMSGNSAYLGIYNQMVERYNNNDYSGNIITQSVNLYHYIEEENANTTSSQVTIVVLVIAVIVILLVFLLMIRNKNRKEREF